jgi:hypothetical protein
MDDVQVRSGNARAINHSTVLLDPGVDATRLNLRLRQHAIAAAGNATAGQVIGAAASGGAGCGGVSIDATNLATDVRVRVGNAVGTNDNTVQTCAEVGCAAELRALAAAADQIQLCTTDGCTNEAPAAVVATQPPGVSPAPDATATPDPGLLDPVPSKRPARCPRHGRLAHLPPCGTPEPSGPTGPTGPSGQAAAAPAPTPTPTPTPAPLVK